MGKKLNIELAKDAIENLGSELLCSENEWKGSQEKYNFKCSKCTSIFNRKYCTVNNGKTQCLECAKKSKILNDPRIPNHEEVKYFVEVKSNSGCKLVSMKYINNSTNMNFICSCGKPFITSYAGFKDKNIRVCKECSAKLMREKFAFDYFDVKQYIENYNFKLLSKEYINCRGDLSIQCLTCNTVNKSSFSNFKIMIHKCPICATKIVSEKIRFSESYVIDYLFKYGYILLSKKRVARN